jgi:hypothetical protein
MFWQEGTRLSRVGYSCGIVNAADVTWREFAATSKIVRQRDRKQRVVAQRLQVVSLRETRYTCSVSPFLVP